MKKIFLKFLNISALILLCTALLCSCEDKSQNNLIDLHSFPFEYTGRLVFDGTEYSVNASAENESSFSVTFLQPNELEGVSFVFENGEPHILYDGTKIPLSDSEYFTENGVLLMKEMFSQTKEDLVGISIETIENEELNAAEYVIESGRVTVYSKKDRTLPVHIRLKTPDHEITFSPQGQN